MAISDIIERKLGFVLGQDYARELSKIVNLNKDAVFFDDFWGADTFTSAGQGSPWVFTATGTPTCATASPSATGEVTMAMSSTNQVENGCLSFGDKLCFDIDNLKLFEARVKISGAMTTGSELVFGLGSARNNTTDSVANNAWFKMVGATSTTNVTAETDDGTTDRDDIATGAVLGTTYKTFRIDFTKGKSNVKFFIDEAPVATSTVFNMSAATSSLQPMIQIQKAANTNVNAVTLDYVMAVCRR